MPRALCISVDGTWKVDPSLGGQFAGPGIYWLEPDDNPVDPVADPASPEGWRELAPSEIEARDLEPTRTARLAAIRAEAKATILEAYPDWYQRDVAMGVYKGELAKACVAFIKSVIAESNRCEDIVVAARTCTDIDAVVPEWPTAGVKPAPTSQHAISTTALPKEL